MNPLFTKEIKVEFEPDEQAFYLWYYLHGPKATIQFMVRCPSPEWHYYLPIDLGFHADSPTYEQEPIECEVRPSGQCFYDGSSLAAQDLWAAFTPTGDEAIIWNKLEEVMNERFA
jgi:hypothetical protein